MLPPRLLVPARVACHLDITSKKRSLETAAELLVADTDALQAGAVFDRLLERERLGCTGLGHGIALPHARIASLCEPRGAFLTLAAPVDFDALDGEPVDLIFALLVPEAAEERHLQILADLAQRFNDADFRDRLRRDPACQVALSLLSGEEVNETPQ